MKVLGILGSPHPNGNTATLLNQVLDGASQRGATVTKIAANTLTIRSCQGCEACRKTGKCILKDDMNSIYEQIDTSDVIILASPNYMGGIAGNLKPLIDRLHAYITVDTDGALGTTIKKPKKVLLLITQNAPENFTQYLEAFTPLRSILHLIFHGNADDLAECLVAFGMKGPHTVANDPELLQKAFTLGLALTE